VGSGNKKKLQNKKFLNGRIKLSKRTSQGNKSFQKNITGKIS
jgi:hypothetical protein